MRETKTRRTPPYRQYLDTEATLALEFTIKNFDGADALHQLHQFDHQGEPDAAALSDPRAHFERVRRLFAAQTGDDYILRDYVASECDSLRRALAINGKLTIMAPITNDNAILSALLSELATAIWADIEGPR